MLAGGVGATLDRALVLEAAVALEEQLESLAAAESADGIRITSHFTSS
jgi:hypothetical protein